MIPLPENRGVGFSTVLHDEFNPKGYRQDTVGHYNNYYFTEDNWQWPILKSYKKLEDTKFDAFSPNLNKSLHIGHLRNLAIALFLKRTIGGKHHSLLGASVGVYKWAQDELFELMDFVKYKPDEIHYDVLMPWDLVPRYLETQNDELNGCEVWSENPSVIVTTSKGKHTYSFYDIAFANTVKPDYYLTGSEQYEHFKMLGLRTKYLAMGLVLGVDGKKMQSRKQNKDGTGVTEPYTAKEAFEDIISNLKETPDPRKLAWNIMAWNFLHVGREKALQFNPVEWVKTEAPGMYISYTYARVRAALMETEFKGTYGPFINLVPSEYKYVRKGKREELRQDLEYDKATLAWSKDNPDPNYDLTESDIELLGYSSYLEYYLQIAQERMDSAALASYTHSLARKLGEAYHKEKIKDGRYGFQYAVNRAWCRLRDAMYKLGMFQLEKV